MHAPERSKVETPCKFTKQCHPTSCHEAKANSQNDASTMERCGASRWNQIRTTNQPRHGALRLGKPCPDSHAQRPASGSHEARPIQLPGRVDEAALPTKTPVFERHSP